MSEENEGLERSEKVYVSIAEIKIALKKGITRRVGDPSYNADLGSVQEMYGMTKAETTLLFQDSRLKGLKVVIPKPTRIVIMEDIPAENVEETQDDVSGTEPTDYPTALDDAFADELPTAAPTASVNPIF